MNSENEITMHVGYGVNPDPATDRDFPAIRNAVAQYLIKTKYDWHPAYRVIEPEAEEEKEAKPVRSLNGTARFMGALTGSLLLGLSVLTYQGMQPDNRYRGVRMIAATALPKATLTPEPPYHIIGELIKPERVSGIPSNQIAFYNILSEFSRRPGI